MAEGFVKDNKNVEEPPEATRTKKTSRDPLPVRSGSEVCHFCQKRVYVVERMSAEGKFFHRSCFRCDYCNILLRMGSYVYVREGMFGGMRKAKIACSVIEYLLLHRVETFSFPKFWKRNFFPGKFFCLPHSTNYALEKYRYKCKTEEIKDSENRQKELGKARVASEWQHEEG